MKAALVLLAAAATASAHATWQELWVGTEDEAGSCVRRIQDNSPIANVTDPTVACGRGPKATTGNLHRRWYVRRPRRVSYACDA